LSVLVDSHARVWCLEGNERLSLNARATLDAEKVYVSAASVYDIGNKVRSGKQPQAGSLIRTFQQTCERVGVMQLSVTALHGLAAAAFEADYRDPFDRLIAAQSLVEYLPVVTIDPAFKLFGRKVIWQRALTLGRADNRQS
jgi:PIN domain nuclease of toxin-antitoxin system